MQNFTNKVNLIPHRVTPFIQCPFPQHRTRHHTHDAHEERVHLQVGQCEGFRRNLEWAVEMCSGADDEESEEEGGKEGHETQFEQGDEEFPGRKVDIRIRPMSRENLPPVSPRPKKGLTFRRC
jgi:hypothetical protein